MRVGFRDEAPQEEEPALSWLLIGSDVSQHLLISSRAAQPGQQGEQIPQSPIPFLLFLPPVPAPLYTRAAQPLIQHLSLLQPHRHRRPEPAREHRAPGIPYTYTAQLWHAEQR